MASQWSVDGGVRNVGGGQRQTGVDLPDGISMNDFRESRMLESTFYDVPIEENFEDLMAPTRNLIQRPPSPSTLAARELRQQQDAEFEESQRRDRYGDRPSSPWRQ